MSTVDEAEKTIRTLEAKRQALAARGTKLAEEDAGLGFAVSACGAAVLGTVLSDHHGTLSESERYLDSPYYPLPNDDVGHEAFAVIREAMRGKNMVALGRVVLSKRERVVMLQPWGRGLLDETLRYAYEVRDDKEYFDDLPDVKIASDMLKLAEHILATKKADFDPSEFIDHYEEAVTEMLHKKQAQRDRPEGKGHCAAS